MTKRPQKLSSVVSSLSLVTKIKTPESKTAMTSEVSKLVAAAQAGDRVAFDELVRISYAEMYTLALRLTNHPDDAADVVQEAYLRAYRSIKNFRGDSQFETWLYRITANCSSTYLTRRNKHRHDDLDETAALIANPSSHNPEEKADVELGRREVSIALEKLPPNLRSVVVLRDIYDMTHEEIARELGISEITAKVRLHRARKKLRDYLLPQDEKKSNARAV